MSERSVVALSGGVGGAKLVLGLDRILPPGALTVIVNTGDDFEHLGLAISPDIDTTLYTLAGLANAQLGWGRADETWSFMAALEELGGEVWFRLGDKDLALHIERTRRRAAGQALSRIVADVAARLGIGSRVLPMTDDPVRTRVRTAQGVLDFQHYFVRERCAPAVSGIEYHGAERARATPAGLAALAEAQLECVILCPSNPYLSLEPLLAIPAWREGLLACPAPVVAVSPIIGGEAVKGPTAKIMRELGLASSALTVARHYGQLLDGFVLDEADAALAPQLQLPVHVTRTLMRTEEDKRLLARETLAFAASLRRTGGG